MKLWDTINGYKTYLVAVVTIIYAVVGVGISQNDWGSAVNMILGATGLGALRHGVSKVAPSTKG